jgi:hypothetical protein
MWHTGCVGYIGIQPCRSVRLHCSSAQQHGVPRLVYWPAQGHVGAVVMVPSSLQQPAQQCADAFRACDDVVSVAKLCAAAGVPHLINNAYGVQSTDICKRITSAWRKGGWS